MLNKIVCLSADI